MAQLSTLLDSIYNVSEDREGVEKTAEASLLEALRDDGGISENPFDSLPLEDLLKMASEAGLGDESGGQEEQGSMEKAAMDVLGGQIMAHATFHEMSLIKTALVNGQCRVCKTNGLDVEGSSICSTCLQG